MFQELRPRLADPRRELRVEGAVRRVGGRQVRRRQEAQGHPGLQQRRLPDGDNHDNDDGAATGFVENKIKLCLIYVAMLVSSRSRNKRLRRLPRPVQVLRPGELVRPVPHLQVPGAVLPHLRRHRRPQEEEAEKEEEEEDVNRTHILKKGCDSIHHYVRFVPQRESCQVQTWSSCTNSNSSVTGSYPHSLISRTHTSTWSSKV